MHEHYHLFGRFRRCFLLVLWPFSFHNWYVCYNNKTQAFATKTTVSFFIPRVSLDIFWKRKLIKKSKQYFIRGIISHLSLMQQIMELCIYITRVSNNHTRASSFLPFYKYKITVYLISQTFIESYIILTTNKTTKT
jgi:hypothetical protein